MTAYTEITRHAATGEIWIRYVRNDGWSLVVFTPGPCYVCLPGHPAEPISVYPAREEI